MDFSYDNLGFCKIPIGNTLLTFQRTMAQITHGSELPCKCNEKRTNRISPYLLTYERYPCSPVDAIVIISGTED